MHRDDLNKFISFPYERIVKGIEHMIERGPYCGVPRCDYASLILVQRFPQGFASMGFFLHIVEVVALDCVETVFDIFIYPE